MSNTEEKLLQRPVEADTKILTTMILDFGDHKALYEKWIWDGISASSVVCLMSDIKQEPDKAFVEGLFTKMKLPVDPQATYGVQGEYFFLNFGFNISGDD